MAQDVSQQNHVIILLFPLLGIGLRRPTYQSLPTPLPLGYNYRPRIPARNDCKAGLQAEVAVVLKYCNCCLPCMPVTHFSRRSRPATASRNRNRDREDRVSECRFYHYDSTTTNNNDEDEDEGKGR